MAIVIAFILSISITSIAHPLGNFTINHYTRIDVAFDQIKIRYVVDMAEIPTFQELQSIGSNTSPSSDQLNQYIERMAALYADGILLTVDGKRVPLQVLSTAISLPPGAGNLPTLRVECDLAGTMPAGISVTPRLRFEDTNHRERIGWRELVVKPLLGVNVFNSNAYGNGLTDELKAYPEDMLTAPLNEKTAEFSFTSGTIPPKASLLLTRDGKKVSSSKDRLTELIAVPELTPAIALLGLLIATMLGGVHALSPGHGKTVVGAYLVGSRGTAKHAAFLGLTVTITHTAGVFALGLITLFATQYIVPEKIIPILSLISGLIVVGIGLSLFIKRLRFALEIPGHVNAYAHVHDGQPHSHDDMQDHEHNEIGDPTVPHSHGGRVHSHLPPGADGSQVTWRSLLALGISGGLLPCPSALVVLLSAISLNRIGYGLVLVIAFSAGLAGVLTAIGLLFVYAKRFMDGRILSSGRLVRVMPVFSSFVISCLGLAICYEALGGSLNISSILNSIFHSAGSVSQSVGAAAVSILGLGFILGLQHALDADHLAAVSAIVTESKSILSSSLVGAIWGIGHTLSLLIAGVAVILLNLKIGEKTEKGLEFCVGIMLIGLGANAIYKLARGGKLHLHAHQHGGHSHLHPHIHENSSKDESGTHHGFRLSPRPLLVGMMHGLAGSAGLMLLVVASTQSPLLSLTYIAVFGIGSIGGMLVMSALVSLPIHLTTAHFARVNFAVRTLAGVFSFVFGLFMVYEKGFVEGLFR
jgi:nickel/cobalt transporter (NicO) family protein